MKGLKLGLAISLAMVCLARPASATAPIFSGLYIVNTESICPAVLTEFQNKTGDVTNILTSANGDVTMNVLAVTFTPASKTPNAGKISGAGFTDELNGTLQGPGQTISSDDRAINVSGTFSNTANSLTLTGSSANTFHVLYGALKSNVVQFASYTGRTSLTNGSPPTTVTCVEHGTLTIE